MQQYRQIIAFPTTTYPPLTKISHLTIFIVPTWGAGAILGVVIDPEMTKFDIFRGKSNVSLPRNNDAVNWLPEIKCLGHIYVISYNLHQYFYLLGSHFLGKRAVNGGVKMKKQPC